MEDDDFRVSVADEERDIDILAPWLLAAIYELAQHKADNPVRRTEAFKKVNLGGFQADKQKYLNYILGKGDKDYEELVEKTIMRLMHKGFIRLTRNNVFISISSPGISAVNSGLLWDKRYYPPS